MLAENIEIVAEIKFIQSGGTLNRIEHREHLADELVDLIYLYPPFNSERPRFPDLTLGRATFKRAAFEDVWAEQGKITMTAILTVAYHWVQPMLSNS